jgi:hypothetical protein
MLARDPHQSLARAVLLIRLLETGAAEAGLAWTRMPEGIAPAPDEEQMMKRMRAALLRALHRAAEADEVTRSLRPGVAGRAAPRRRDRVAQPRTTIPARRRALTTSSIARSS